MPQTDDQLLAQLANWQGIDRVIDRLATDVGIFEFGEFHGAQLAGNLFGRKAFAQQVDHQIEQLRTRHKLFPRPAYPATLTHRALGLVCDVLALCVPVAPDLAADSGGTAFEHPGNLALAHASQQADLDVGALFDAEFVVRHGNTVPGRSGVALSFCGRQAFRAAFQHSMTERRHFSHRA
ncbi:hypothetical protein D3C78_718420 [compost metagenome]